MQATSRDSRIKNDIGILFKELRDVLVNQFRVSVRIDATDLPDAAEVIDDGTRRLLVCLEPLPNRLLVVITSTARLAPTTPQHPMTCKRDLLHLSNSRSSITS